MLSDLFIEACQQGNIDTILALIQRGCNDFNAGLRNACLMGRMNIVLLMISKGAFDWNSGMINACQGGHYDIALFMIEKGANNWDKGLVSALWERKVSLILLMLKHGAIIDTNTVYLADYTILWLLRLGVTSFGRYEWDKNFREYRRIILIQKQVLNAYLIEDLTSIVAQY